MFDNLAYPSWYDEPKGHHVNIEQVARVAHETNRAYCASIGDDSQKSWDEAEEWQRDSILRGVKFAIDNPDISPSGLHDAWCRSKIAEGWKYGSVKDPIKKEHHCLVPYGELPAEQRIKDHLLIHVIKAFSESTE